MAAGEHSASGTDPVTLKGSSYTLTSARLATTDLAAIATYLVAKVEQAPAFFKDAPVVIDLEEVVSRPLDLPGLLKVLRSHGMVPIGVRGGSEKHRQEAGEVGLALLKGTPLRADAGVTPEAQAEPRHTESPPEAATDDGATSGRTPGPAAEQAVAAEAPPAPAVEAIAGKLVRTPVRGGQQFYAPGGDLVLLAGVNQGAEVLADGHVHVYGPLRGRALAGARGNRDARIFTTCLEAELLSIAGTYRVIENDLPDQLRGKPAQVFLEGDSLRIEPLN